MRPSPMAIPALQCAGRSLDLSVPQVMGVLNVTPDSFSDGGVLYRNHSVDTDALCRRVEAMLNAGATVLDIGGESTRPGAAPVSETEELDRVIPALELVVSRFDAIVSLDTSTPAVMLEGAARGAGILNDVRALKRPGALDAAASTGLPVCLMHMQGEPDTMQQRPSYEDVVAEVAGELMLRVSACEAAGIDRSKLLLDPGFGFGKSPAHNYSLLNRLDEIVALGFPVLAGLSRKSMIAAVIEREPSERLPASLALAVLAAVRGAKILRVHDVAETADALAMVAAMQQEGP